MAGFEPAYRQLLRSGNFSARVHTARQALRDCALCAWACHVDRVQTVGFCRTGQHAYISSAFPHMEEEAPLRGTRGSGTVFFARCNMRCQFCQNYEISQLVEGEPLRAEQLAALMLRLQALGCHNINLVSPSHVIPQIIEAVYLAARQGLCVPLGYNTGGYDALAGLQLLEGIVDTYMPDMKYADAELAQRYSKSPDYPAHNRAAVRKMHRQTARRIAHQAGLRMEQQRGWPLHRL